MAYDDVGLFGLDEFGDPTGLSPLYGAAIGAGVGSLAAAAVRQLAPAPAAPTDFDWHKNSALIGAAAGIAAGGVMVAFPGTRHAGWVAMLTAALSQGITALEAYLSQKPVFAGLGTAVLQRRNAYGLGNAQMQSRNISGPHLLGRGQLLGMGAHKASYGTTSVG